MPSKYENMFVRITSVDHRYDLDLPLAGYTPWGITLRGADITFNIPYDLIVHAEVYEREQLPLF